MLWGMDFTCVANCKGFIHVAFDIESLAHTIGGWRVSASAHAGHRHCLLDRWRRHGAFLDAAVRA
jgi:hypothetical protein